MTKFEEEYLGVLQNLEFALVTTYRSYPEMLDFDALNAVNELIRTYSAEQKGRSDPKLKLRSECQKVAYDSLKSIAEYNMGRGGDFVAEDGRAVQLPDTAINSLSEIVACLKRLRKSIQIWQKQGGRRGYYQFISDFIQ